MVQSSGPFRFLRRQSHAPLQRSGIDSQTALARSTAGIGQQPFGRRQPQPRLVRLRRASLPFALELCIRPGAGTLLFYPGTMLSPTQYRGLLLAAHDAGLTTAGLHLEGHGVNPHCAGFTFDDLLADGLLAEAWLHDQGLGPVAVCGHSQGGILALAHAAASTTLSAAFALCAVFPQMAEAITLTRFAMLARHRAALERAIARAAAVLPRLPLPLACYLSAGRVLAGHCGLRFSRRRCRFTYPLGFLASLFLARVPTRLNCPFWLFNARDDALFTPRLATAVFNLVRAPQKHLVWLPRGGHLAPMNPRLGRFLARSMAACCAGRGMPLLLGAADRGAR